MLTKRCSKCGVVKPLAAFVRKAEAPDGHAPTCRECKATVDAAYRAANRSKIAAGRAVHYAANRGKIAAAVAAYRAANPEAAAARHAAWVRANREHNNAMKAAWARANPPESAKSAAKNARRRAAELLATPAWANLDLVAAYYVIADAFTRGSGVRHEVDHVEPLRGKHVCGLHNEFNLQVLPAKINRAKGNRPSEIKGFR